MICFIMLGFCPINSFNLSTVMFLYSLCFSRNTFPSFKAVHRIQELSALPYGNNVGKAHAMYPGVLNSSMGSSPNFGQFSHSPL
ncbi:hypothetical protein KUF71_000347 [Frankliniella fusca]|uniref:Uncharacterized protein n=1 Tax=Frankliniella fusca TaxID=407009 RepID=A0AAE1HMG1_9NEOP|nr:hypothetical protein KUF71_000347 [Frankliniella fusca]